MSKFDKWIVGILVGIILTLIGVVWSQTVKTEDLYMNYYTKQEIKCFIDENQRVILTKLEYIEKAVTDIKESGRRR
jgi:hypothetical protein